MKDQSITENIEQKSLYSSIYPRGCLISEWDECATFDEHRNNYTEKYNPSLNCLHWGWEEAVEIVENEMKHLEFTMTIFKYIYLFFWVNNKKIWN